MKNIHKKISEEIQEVMKKHDVIRYVAVFKGEHLSTTSRHTLSHGSSSESDRYEELIVNPTLIKLLQQRGNIDCGGLHYVMIRYGNFFQWVTPIPNGHISIGLELTMNREAMEPVIEELVRKVQHE